MHGPTYIVWANLIHFSLKAALPPKCKLNSTWPPCAWYCDTQSCAPGQCHPNDVGCAHLAEVVYQGCDGCWK